MSKKYLENELCEFKPLFDINYETKINIISTCFFKLSESYKDFSLYANGVRTLSEYVKEHEYYSKFKIRLFIDRTIADDKEIYDSLKKLDNVQLVLYSCPNYILQDGYHMGLFGTIVRFFPFFDFPNNDANIVFCTDIDSLSLKPYSKGKDFVKLHKELGDDLLSQIYLVIMGRLFGFNELDIYKYPVYKNQPKDWIYAGEVVVIKKIDRKVLVEWLIMVRKSNKSVMPIRHHDASPLVNKNIDKFGNFIYGIDEWFLNCVLYTYLLDNKKTFCQMGYWNLLENNYVVKNRDEDAKYNFYKYVCDKAKIPFDGSHKNLHNDFYNIREIYRKSNNEKLKYKLMKAAYKFMLYAVNLKLFPRIMYDLLVNDERYFGIYDIVLVRLYKENEIINFLFEHKKFLTGTINKFKHFYQKRLNSKNVFWKK